MPTREQERARFALGKVEGARDQQDLKRQSKLKTQLLKLPARLHSNGLGQTVAFYLSAGPGSPEDQIYLWLECWLRDQPIGIYPPGRRLIDGITAGSDDAYRRASEEARALALWLKRFAEAFLAGEPG